VEDSENEDIGVGDLVSDFVVSDQNPAYFTRLEFSESGSQPRVSRNPPGAGDQLTNGANGGRDVNGLQKFV
jgi:hypothetical protein